MSSTIEPATDRTSEILEVTKIMLDTYHAWQSGNRDNFPRDLEDAMSSAVAVVCWGGDIPSSCLRLMTAYLEFGEVWTGVLDGTNVGDDDLPIQEFWDRLGVLEKAYTSVRRAAAHPNRLESVAELMKTFGDDHRRYEWVARVYGKKNPDTGEWTGPFWDEFGVLLTEAIDLESKNAGSVVKDPSALSTKSANEQVAEGGRARMASLKAKLTHVEFREDPATIQELLEMGQYPDVIARSKNVPIGEVLKLAAELGMEVSNREADLAYNPADPIRDMYTGGGNNQQAKTDDVTLESITGTKLKNRVKALLETDPEMDAPSACAALAKSGFSATMDDVKSTITKQKA